MLKFIIFNIEFQKDFYLKILIVWKIIYEKVKQEEMFQ